MLGIVTPTDFHIFQRGWNHQPVYIYMGMDQYLLIPFLGGWTSMYQLFWCSPGVQGFDTLPYIYDGFPRETMFDYWNLFNLPQASWWPHWIPSANNPKNHHFMTTKMNHTSPKQRVIHGYGVRCFFQLFFKDPCFIINYHSWYIVVLFMVRTLHSSKQM